MAPSSVFTVFSAVELLESILLHASLRDLLQLQRVCHQWNDTITASPSLQQALFLQPSENPPPQNGWYSSRFNPLLRPLFPQLFDQEKPEISDPAWSIRQMDWYTDPKIRSAVLREEASWRRMFPVQPPAKIIHILRSPCPECSIQGPSCNGVIKDEYQYLQESGARMGLLFDLLVGLMDKNAGGAFHVDWSWKLADLFQRAWTMCGTMTKEREEYIATLDNEITIHEWHSDHTERTENEGTGLRVVDFDQGILKWGELEAERPSSVSEG